MPARSRSLNLKVLVPTPLATLVVGAVVRTAFLDWYRIPQNGLYPGLPAGSLVFVSKRAYSSASYRPVSWAKANVISKPLALGATAPVHRPYFVFSARSCSAHSASIA